MVTLLNIFSILYAQFIGFLVIWPLIEMYKTGDYSSLHTLQGIENAIRPVIPLLLIIEIF